ncbi:uncharacterized protein [Apostichopus japonicus]
MDSETNTTKPTSYEMEQSMGFGSFKVALAGLLKLEIILHLATYFEYPPAKISELRETPGEKGLVMATLMEERGQINSNDISPLLLALDKLKLFGIMSSTRHLFELHTGKKNPEPLPKPQSRGKTKLFLEYLRSTYTLWFNKIQPIPYIRDHVACVDDIYIETGMEVTKRSPSNEKDLNPDVGSRTKKLKSYRDVFSDNVISSNRVILHGDAGYGKSCFTLKAAHDWCTENILSPLKDVGIFILLPLRLLGDISSLFLAISLLLMPGESRLTEDDIMEVLNNSCSVVIVLDGYDEYPDKDSGVGTDIIKLTAGTMFANFKVITCTRSSCIPQDLDPRTVFIRLTGFDDNAKNEYIHRAVVGEDNEEAADRIKRLLSSSHVISDICQVPLFCVMFAHIANEEEDLVKFTSVTTFFRYMLTCFYNHMWRKKDTASSKKRNESPADHTKLNKVVFNDLTGSTQQIVWDKHEFKNKIGSKCYDELIEIGILLEDEVMEVNNTPGVSVHEHIRRREIVRFYHKLFAEWYAANYLADCAGSIFTFWLNTTFERVNPLDLQFVFRFACGLNTKASQRIIEYLRKIDDGQSFASLCFFEQMGSEEDIIDTAKQMCSDGMVIGCSDSRLLQRSNIQILDIASKGQIPVTYLQLKDSFRKIDGSNIILSSGLDLPCPLSVATMSIIRTSDDLENVRVRNEEHSFQNEQESEDVTVSQDTVTKLLQYGLKSRALKELTFEGHMLPLSFPPESIPDLQSKDIKISWKLLNFEFRLDLQSGNWKMDDIETIRKTILPTVSLENFISRKRETATILLLANGTYHNMGIPCLHFLGSFDTIYDKNIKLQSGLVVACPTSVKRVHLAATGNESSRCHEDRALTEEDVLAIFQYSLQSQTLAEIIFEDYLLPLKFDHDRIQEELKSRRIKVYWRLNHRQCFLELESGLWKHHDVHYVQSIRDTCSRTVKFTKNQKASLQYSNIQLLVIASNHDIQIHGLHLIHTFGTTDGITLSLRSGVAVPKVSVKSIRITKQYTDSSTADENEINEEQIEGLLQYGLQSEYFCKLSFQECLLPLTFRPLSEELQTKARAVRVSWCLCDRKFLLDSESGQWKVKKADMASLQDRCSRDIFIENTASVLRQRSTIQELVIASNNTIPIRRLCLRGSFQDIDGEDIVLTTGLRLQILTSVETIEIRAEGREISDEVIGGILKYANQSHNLKEMKFYHCLLPFSIPVPDIRESLRSKKVIVYWYPSYNLGHNYQLHLHSGHWLRAGLVEITDKQYDEEVDHVRSIRR